MGLAKEVRGEKMTLFEVESAEVADEEKVAN